MPTIVQVPSDLIQEMFANMPVRPKSANPNANARPFRLPVLWQDNDPDIEIIRRPRIDKDALAIPPLPARGHIQILQRRECSNASSLKCESVVSAPHAIAFVTRIVDSGRLQRLAAAVQGRQ